METEVVVAPDLAALARTASLRLARGIETAVREREWCWLALSGGAFAAPIYDELAILQVPWPKVEFYFTDERCVPSSHPASNYGEALDRLFTNPRIGSHQVHRIEAERPDHDAVAESYERELPEAFDLMLVEMGLDGHFAGIFPGSPAVEETERQAIAVEVPLKPRKRITLTPPVFERAGEIVVVATGREKADKVQRALHGTLEPAELPAQLLRNAVWILDRAAAAAL
jgi:6-phosphogluconolactonase